MEWFSKIMYWISNGLMVPVMLVLIVFFVRALMMIGSLFGLYSIRKSVNSIKEFETAQLSVDNVSTAVSLITVKGLLPKKIKEVEDHKESVPHMDQLITDFEMLLQKELDRVGGLAKLGPILGLMGTLIPMGPALLGLAAGDIATMAQNLQVAFSTTVIGLFIGAVGYFVKQVKQRWFTEDINKLEFVVALFKQKIG